MKMRLLILLVLLGLFSCTQKEKDLAQSIVDEAITTHGGAQYDDLNIIFRFRKYDYHIIRSESIYDYQRTYIDSSGIIIEALNNEGTSKKVNGQMTEMDIKTKNKVSESINSQVYFALLPFGLNDLAVNKEYLGETTVEGQPYHKIRVTFDEEGGGKDFEDIFIYWFHKENKTMDYLAYEFHVNKGGFRFRKAYNQRKVGGILWSDYINYKESDATTPLEKYDQLLEEGKLIELSRIELEDIKVVE